MTLDYWIITSNHMIIGQHIMKMTSQDNKYNKIIKLLPRILIEGQLKTLKNTFHTNTRMEEIQTTTRRRMENSIISLPQ